MLTAPHVFALLMAYLIGSIPTAVWIGRFFYGIDVREHGSGNSGATNTFRVIGKRAGVPVLLIDIFKGWAAVNMAYLVSDQNPKSEQFLELQMVLGVVALMGHIFPILAAFRGGKGIATLLGVILALHLEAALVSLGVFLVVFLASRYVSLGSLAAAVCFPISLIFLFPTGVPSFAVFGIFAAVLVLFTHQKNIERLLKREESRMSLGSKETSTPEEETITR
jgi:acyl phosphate:glycerol-3-phosphate acyltransferase